MSDALFWFIMMFSTIIIGAFFSLQEGIVITHDRLILNYKIKKGDKSAKKILFFLNNPDLLFTTLLFLSEFFLHFGSEFSRCFFMSISVPEFIIPFIYVFLTVLFSELVPLFFAKQFPHSLSGSGICIIFLLSYIFRPVVKVLKVVVRWFFKSNFFDKSMNILKREDILFALKENSENYSKKIISIFDLQKSPIQKLVSSLIDVPQINDTVCKAEHVKKLFLSSGAKFLIFKHVETENVFLVFPKDILNGGLETIDVSSLMSPIIVSGNATVLSLFNDCNLGSCDIVLSKDENDNIQGWFDLANVFSFVFDESSLGKLPMFLERKISAATTIEELKNEIGIEIKGEESNATISELLRNKLGRHPVIGDCCYFDGVEIIVENVSIYGPKSVTVRAFSGKAFSAI